MLLMFRKSTGLELEPNRAEFWPSHSQAPGVPHWDVHGDPRRDQRSKGLLVKVRPIIAAIEAQKKGPVSHLGLGKVLRAQGQ